MKEAVTEIKRIAKADPVTAAEGVVCLVERIWPAFQDIDTSSGALGGAVRWAQCEVLPIAIDAPADAKTRGKWLGRFWQAIEDDGVSYLSPVEDRWGELCGSRETASLWADRLLGLVKAGWTSPNRGTYVRGTTLCLSSLVAAGRDGELFEVLALARFPNWDDRRFGVQVLLAEGRIDEALAYAEASRGLNQPSRAIDAACEKIMLDAGRMDEAYQKYGLTATDFATGLTTFRAVSKKYPNLSHEKILLDLAELGGDPGRWFAAAKDAGCLDLALDFASRGRTDPCTLSRASRDFLEKDGQFAMHTGRLAIERMLEGFGYELTGHDVIEAFHHFIAAAARLGVAAEARKDVLAMAEESRVAFRDTVIRLCSSGSPVTPTIGERQTWTRRSARKR